MTAGGNPLLRPGSAAEWARVEAELKHPAERLDETIAERLVRGQRLSAQAAALRRSVRDDRPADARS
jgi:hypothetical protein